MLLDSIIYLTKPGDTYHPKMGSCLGEFTNELEGYGPGSYIEEFVSGGPKNYCYKVRKPDGKYAHVAKIHGFSLNYHAASKLNMKNMKRKVMEFIRNGQSSKTTVTQAQIVRSRNRDVYTKDTPKDYGVNYDKRWLLPDGSTLPYGTCRD